jgi:putative hemolysin
MITLYLGLVFFFLLWVSLFSSTAHGLASLGESLFSEEFGKSKARYLFRPIYTLFDSKCRFTVFYFSLWINAHIGLIGYTIASLFFVQKVMTLYSLTYAVVCSLIFLFLILIVGDLLPRFFRNKNPSRRLNTLLSLASFFLYITLPLTLVVLLVASSFARKERSAKGENALLETQKEILHLLQNAEVTERLDPLDLKLIESVIKFRERIVREVMIPRVDLFALCAETPIREASKLIIEEGYSRIPVYRENIDNITGLLMFKDILELYMSVLQGKKESSILDAPIESITKSVFYVPETKQVSYLLQEFRAKQMHMAIVVDEYGGTEGVVTMEDILEEIVGEIADEYDYNEEVLFSPLPTGGGWIVDARMSLIDAEESFGIDIPQEGDYDTIGGYVFHKAGEIPDKGYMIHQDDFDLEILSSTERSIEKVRITLRNQSDSTLSDDT